MEAIETDRLIGVKAVAAMLGVSWRTALRWADAGLMPWGVKIGGAGVGAKLKFGTGSKRVAKTSEGYSMSINKHANAKMASAAVKLRDKLVWGMQIGLLQSILDAGEITPFDDRLIYNLFGPTAIHQLARAGLVRRVLYSYENIPRYDNCGTPDFRNPRSQCLRYAWEGACDDAALESYIVSLTSKLQSENLN